MSVQLWASLTDLGSARNLRLMVQVGDKKCLCPMTLAEKIALVLAPEDGDLRAELERNKGAIRKTLHSLKRRCKEVLIES